MRVDQDRGPFVRIDGSAVLALPVEPVRVCQGGLDLGQARAVGRSGERLSQDRDGVPVGVEVLGISDGHGSALALDDDGVTADDLAALGRHEPEHVPLGRAPRQQ